MRGGEDPMAIGLSAARVEHRYVATVWDETWSILAQIELAAYDGADAKRLTRRLLLPEHRSRIHCIEVERIT